MAKVELYDEGQIEGLIDQLTNEWFAFRKLIPISDKLVNLAKKYNVKGIKPLSKVQREGFPSQIEFLDIASIEEAVDHLYDLTPKEMELLLRTINQEKKTGIFYKSIDEWIKDARHKIRTAKKPKCYLYAKKDDGTEYEKTVSDEISSVEEQVLIEIRTRTCFPGEA